MNPSAGPAGGGPPPSFKTNVNRAKTKRWVEAKSYSYDGDDWGEADEYDEYGGYAAPGPAQKPMILQTGLRQPGQITAPTAGSLQGRQDIHQSPSSYGEQAYIAPGGKVSQLHDDQSAMGRQLYRQSGDGRINSFSQGQDQRTYSIGSSQHGMSGPGSPPGHAPFQQNYGQQQGPPQMRAPGPGQPMYHQPSQDRSRQSLDGPPRPMGTGPPAANYRGVSYSDRQRLSRDGSRSQSMTSSTSSTDFHSRRDFSPSAMPQPLHTQPRDHPPRKSSLSQDETPRISGGPFPSSTTANPYPPESSEAPIVSSPVELNDQADTASKPLPFVRPADIYKRMAEEREKERQSQESSRPSMEAILGPKAGLARGDSPSGNGLRPSSDSTRGAVARKPSFESGDDSEGGRRQKTSLDPVPERRSEYGMEGLTQGLADPKNEAAIPSTTQLEEVKAPVKALSSSNDKPRLPEVPRMSGFGDSFLGSMGGTYTSTPDIQTDTPRGADNSQDSAHLSPQIVHGTSLQHQPSLGFRSVVNKAFEDQIPQTPSSTAGSAVARSNSESTNGISPIISRAPSAVTSDARVRDTETREHDIPIIPEEPKASTPRRPGSGDTIVTLTRTVGKLSPSQSSQPESSGIISTAVMIGHRRNINTPSPDNSPARTPAVETNLQPPQPQEAELAVTTPTSMTHSSSSASNIFPTNPDERNHHYSGDTVMRVPEEPSHVPHPTAPAVLGASTTSVNEPPSAIHATSSTPQAMPPPATRAESPSKGRVRDLADKFDSQNVSRRGSESSLKGSVHSVNTGKPDEIISSKPPTDRMESFRPHLPGGWESFASNAPSSSAQHPATATHGLSTHSPETDTRDSMSPLNQNTSASGSGISDEDASQPKTTKEFPGEGVERAAASNKSVQPPAPGTYSLSDPFSAVAAAGTALAGAMAAAVGIDQTASESLEDSDREPAKIDKPIVTRSRTGSIQNTAIHPEATQPWMPAEEDDSASSVAPTPLAMDSTDDANDTDNPHYFPPVVPLKQKPREIQTSKDSSAYTRPQMLPTLSTEASPNDYESDRLRKQIVRELSPHTERFPEEQTGERTTPQVDDSRLSDHLNRHESIYDSYWNEPSTGDDANLELSHQDAVASDAPEAGENKAVHETQLPPSVEVQHSITPAISEPVQEVNRADSLQVRPAQLTHRFSWEPVPEEINAPSHNISNEHTIQPPVSTQAPDMDFRTGFMQPSDVNQPSGGNPEVEKQLPEEPKHPDANSALSTAPATQHHLEDSLHLPNSVSTEPVTMDIPLPPLPNDQPKIPPFREILALKTPVERIQMYKATREQFANMNTGLDHWILTTLNDLPEHRELTKNGGAFGNISGHRPSPSRGKFPGLRVVSGQTQPQPYYQQYLNASTQAVSPSQNTPGSTLATSSPTYSPASQGARNSGHQMQAKGKDLLHTAGLFGGKANVAAKGLFSKGKSKFRGSGGADKATPRTSSDANPDSTRGMEQQYLSPKLQTEDPSLPGSSDRVDKNRHSPDSLDQSLPHESTHRAILSSPSHDTSESPQQRTLPTGDAAVQGGQLPLDSTGTVQEINDELELSELPEESSTVGHDHPVLSSHVDPPQNPAVSPPSKSPQIRQSPKSQSPNNRTPTQADFGPNSINRDLPSLPSPLPPFDTPPRSASDDRGNTGVDIFSQSVPIYGHEDARDKIPQPNGFSTGSGADASSLTQGNGNSLPLEGAQQSKDRQGPFITTPRTSEDSGATFHTADSGEEIQMKQQMGRAVAIPPRSIPQPIRAIAVRTSARKAGNSVEGNSSNSTSKQASSTNSATAVGESNNAARPFSFISFGQPVGDLTLRGPSLDNGRGRLYKDLPLTPASSQQSVNNSQSQAAPVHHNTSHDFTSERGQVHGKSRPRSFSRPFQDPNLHDHPAFRQENAEIDNNNLPSNYYPAQVRREEAMIPQGTEYQLEGIGPPAPEDLNKSEARRSSRGSAFFKRLSFPSAQDTPPMPHDTGAQTTDLPSDSPLSQKKKGKRVSLFRSLTGRSGSDSGRSPGVSAAQPTRAQTDLQQYVDTSPPSQRQYSSPRGQQANQSPPIGQGSNRPSKKLQRSPISGSPEQEKGKKKRFSSLGTFLGRMSPKQQSSSTPTPHPRNSSQQLPPQPQTPFDEWRTPDDRRRAVSTNQVAQGSAYHTNHQEYYQPLPPPPPPPEYGRPPLEGYYSPDNKEGIYPFGDLNGQPLQTDYQQPKTQPYVPLGRSSLSQSPPSNSQTYSNYQNSSIMPSSNTSPQYQSYGRSPSVLQTRNQGLSIRSVSANPDAAYGDTIMRNPQGYHETPQVRGSSPAPPPPPPKDDHLPKSPRSPVTSHTRSSSQNALSKPETSSPSPRGPTQIRQTLPPLQTSVAQAIASSSKPITPEDVRKERQRQIEESGPVPATQTGGEGASRASNEAEEKIVMSSTSYPGQEWQPSFGNWDGD